MCRLATVLPVFLAAVASAGFIGAPLAHGPALALGPAGYYHPASVASSYSNTVRVVHSSVPIVRPVALHPATLEISHGPSIAIGHSFHR